MFLQKFATATVLAFGAFALVSCSAQTENSSESFSDSAPELVDDSANQAAREFNCGLVASFTAGKWYDESWNTYDQWEHWEKNLWQDIDAADPTSWNALMELRRIRYSQDLAAPPALGHVYSWDEAAQDADIVAIDDFVPDSEKETAVDAAATICPKLDTQFWDERFHIRKFTF